MQHARGVCVAPQASVVQEEKPKVQSPLTASLKLVSGNEWIRAFASSTAVLLDIPGCEPPTPLPPLCTCFYPCFRATKLH